MNSKAARKFHRKLVAILLPSLLITVGLLSVVSISYWSKAKQSDKYSLPADRSAKSMLAFLRRLDGEYDPRATWLSESNLTAVNDAVGEAIWHPRGYHDHAHRSNRQSACLRHQTTSLP